MEHSEDIKELITALHKARTSFIKLTKDKNNPFFKSKYADLEQTVEKTREALEQQGLVVMQGSEVRSDIDGSLVSTVLLHTSGQWIKFTAKTKAKTELPQDVGSSITYLRRYGLQAILGLTAEDEDDGNYASDKGPDAERQRLKNELETLKKENESIKTALKENQKNAVAFVNAVKPVIAGAKEHIPQESLTNIRELLIKI